jgi:uncharacterized protein
VRVVIDTNVLLVCISKRSRVHWIWESLINERYTLCVTTDILAEYAEIIEQHMGFEAAEAALSTIENLPNIERVTVWYRLNLLNDADDNKFVDCAIATNAHFIVSHDRDFLPLKTLPFPKVDVIDTDTFKNRLNI